MEQQLQRKAIGVDHGMELSSFDLLAGIITVRAASLGDFHALTGDYGCRGHRLAPGADAVHLDEMMVQILKPASVA